MPPQTTAIERDGRSAVVRLQGDLVVKTVGPLYVRLRGLAKQRDTRTVVLDFTGVGRIDSSGSAIVSLLGRQLRRAGKKLELQGMSDQHRATIELTPDEAREVREP